jgi:hypothetical protein
MADKKISALTAASTPLAGTEVLPIVQSGATVKVAVSDLTAGRAISATTVTASTGDITSTAGNFVVGTSGKGIDFSATPGTGTSELLADYEEGTFTATMTPETSGTITLETTVQTLVYTKVGRLVYVNGLLQVNSVSLPVGSYVSVTLPFVVINTGNQSRFGSASVVNQAGTYSNKVLLGVEGTSVVRLYITASTIASTDQFSFGFSYATT